MANLYSELIHYSKPTILISFVSCHYFTGNSNCLHSLLTSLNAKEGPAIEYVGAKECGDYN